MGALFIQMTHRLLAGHAGMLGDELASLVGQLL